MDTKVYPGQPPLPLTPTHPAHRQLPHLLNPEEAAGYAEERGMSAESRLGGSGVQARHSFALATQAMPTVWHPAPLMAHWTRHLSPRARNRLRSLLDNTDPAALHEALHADPDLAAELGIVLLTGSSPPKQPPSIATPAAPLDLPVPYIAPVPPAPQLDALPWLLRLALLEHDQRQCLQLWVRPPPAALPLAASGEVHVDAVAAIRALHPWRPTP